MDRLIDTFAALSAHLWAHPGQLVGIVVLGAVAGVVAARLTKGN